MTLVTITRTGRGTRVRVLYEVPRGYMVISRHSGSCDHGCGDQCCRQQFQLSHSSSPFVKSQYHLAPGVAGLASGDCRATESTRWLCYSASIRLGRRLIYSDEPRLLGLASVSTTQHSREHRFAITLPLVVAATVVTLKLGRPGAALRLTFPVTKGCRSEISSPPSFSCLASNPVNWATRLRTPVDGPMTCQNCDRDSESGTDRWLVAPILPAPGHRALPGTEDRSHIPAARSGRPLQSPLPA